jgi:plastocyanin
MTRRAVPFALVLTAFALVLTACGGGGGSATTTGGAATGGGGGGQTLQLAADPGGALKFDQASLSASAGKVTIDFTNDSSLPHNVTVEGNGITNEATDTIKQSSATLSLDLKPGTYTFFCSVDGHRAAGMEGTLVVK